MEYIVKILTKNPGVNVELLAVDINQSSCDEATGNFAAVALEYGKQFKFNVLCCDILEVPIEEHGSFDAVIVVHTLYFVPALKDVLKKCYVLKKSEGGELKGQSTSSMQLHLVSIIHHVSPCLMVTATA